MFNQSIDRRRLLQFCAVLGASGLGRPAIAQRVRTYRFGHMMPADTIYHKAMLMFADEVAKLSGGKLKIDVYPASQLGQTPEMLANLRSGALDIGMAVPAWYSNFIKPMDVFSLPYIVGSADSLKRALDGSIGDDITAMSRPAGFEVLGHWLIGSRHIVNKQRPIDKPDDLRGLKLRVINSQVYIETFRALGASTVAMDPSELYVSLQQGVVDGFEIPLPDLVAYKFYEVARFLSLDAHTTDFYMVSVSKVTWDALTAENQSIFRAAMKTAMDYQWKVQPSVIEASLEKLRTFVAVNVITPEGKELFVKATAPVYQQFEPSIGKEFLRKCVKELA